MKNIRGLRFRRSSPTSKQSATQCVPKRKPFGPGELCLEALNAGASGACAAGYGPSVGPQNVFRVGKHCSRQLNEEPGAGSDAGKDWRRASPVGREHRFYRVRLHWQASNQLEQDVAKASWCRVLCFCSEAMLSAAEESSVSGHELNLNVKRLDKRLERLLSIYKL